MKKHYEGPEVIQLGSVVELTAALGGGGSNDQSDYPQQFPPGQGSYDICNNSDPNSVC